MTKLLLLSSLTLLSHFCFSQSLEGEWKGSYEYVSSSAYPINNVVKINLKFILNNDSTYSVYSYTMGLPSKRRDTTVVCRMSGQFNKDSIYLEEIQVILPEDHPYKGFQKMFLTMDKKKKITELKGVWACEQDNTNGTIYFSKRR